MTQKSPRPAQAQKKKKLLLLLDSNAIVHRAYHALPPLTTASGVQTNAVYGFTTTLFSVLERFQPTHIIAAFDPPGPTFRNDLYANYKATRKETPEDLVPQFALVKEVVDALGIVQIEQAGFEADDVIGTVAKQAARDGYDVVIVTGDKDTLQLVDERIAVFTMSRGIHDMVLYDVGMVHSKTGLLPTQMTDYKGLRGDSSDNIPGVKGVGEKTAVALLTVHQNLDGVYAHLDDVAPGVRAKLERDKAQAYLSKELGTIKTDVPLDHIVDFTAAQTERMTLAAARAMFQRLHFTSLLKRLPQENTPQQIAASEEMAQHYTMIAVTDVARVLRDAAKVRQVVTVDAQDSSVHGIVLAVADEGASTPLYVPHTRDTHADIAAYCADAHALKVCFDAKNLLHVLGHADIVLRGVVDDVMLAAYVVQKTQKFDFASLLFSVTGRMAAKDARDKQMALALRDDTMAQVAACTRARDVRELYQYFRAAVDATVETQTEDTNVRRVLDEVELPLVPILYAMECAGVAIDKERFGEIAEAIDEEIAQLTDAIMTHAGSTFNINSTQQLAHILFDVLRISTDGIKKNKTGYSTASDELAKIRDAHPIVEAVERYRELFKLKTTYADVLPQLADEAGRIHTTFNQAVTTTGRLSSSDPNLQNIPTRTRDGRRLREGFVAREGAVLVSADYSQIDLRCVAHVSGDAELLQAFRDGADIHTYTAARVLGKESETITKEERRSAKELNFGLIYGMGRYGFARAAGIDAKEAEAFIAAYFQRFVGVKKYIDDTKKAARANGYVETLLGRRRYVPEIASKNFQLRAAGERMAINMPIQGLAADIMKLAMIAADDYVCKTWPDDDVRAVLQVHDEIIFEVAESLAEDFAARITAVMESIYTLRIPLVVETAIGTRWSEL